jgi:hypothetical protein
MFCPNNQRTLFNSGEQLPKYKQRLLEKGWPKSFHNEVFPYINEENFAVLYSNNEATRPNSPVNVLVGLLIIKEVLQLTDEELIGSLLFDARFQYAFHTMNSPEQPVSINTLSNFRRRVTRYFEETKIDLVQIEVEAMAKRIAKNLKVDARLLRMDSLMISSSCRKLSRIELVYSVNYLIVKALHKDGFEIPSSCLGYLEKGHKNDTIYRMANQETDSKLITLLAQSEELYQAGLATDEKIMSGKAFKCLERLLTEQTAQIEGNRIIRPGKEIASDSLQNPSDPDATFRVKGHESHIGYVGNLVNAYNGQNQVITKYDLQPNIYSDTQFTADVMAKLAGEETETINLVTDGAFYSDELAQIAPDNIKLIPGQLTGAKPDETKLGYEQFKINEESHEVTSCPAGHKPEEAYYDIKGKSFTVKMSKETCSACPLQERCPIQPQKKQNVARFSEKRYRTDQLRIRMGTEEYRKLTNSRAGIEGLPSVLRRRYGIDEMPIRGYVRAKIWFGFKIAAMNFKSLLKGTRKRAKDQLSYLYLIVKEHFIGFIRFKLELFSIYC